MTRLAALHARITGDSTGFVTAAQKAEDAAQDAAAAMGAGGGARGAGLGAATGKLGGAFKNLSGSPAMRMLPMQFSQVAQQAAAGGGVLRALTIQAADIGLAFGTVGTIVGILATVAMPSIIAAFSDGSDSAEDLTDSLKSIEDMQGRLEGTLSILEMSVDELAETYGRAAGQVRQFAIELAEIQYQQAISMANEYQLAIKSVGSALVNVSKATGQNKRALSQLSKDLGISGAEVQRLADALTALQEAEGIDAQIAASQALTEVMKEVGVTAEDIDDELLNIQGALLQAGIQGAELERVMASVRDRAAEAAAASASIGATYGDPNALAGLAPGDLVAPVGKIDPEKDKKNRGTRAREEDKFAEDLEKLQEQLATELEVEQEMHDKRAEILQQALDRELLTHEEYNDLIERERQRHHDKMSELDVYRYGSGVDQVGHFMGEMATAFASGNEKMMQISKVFGAGEALINAWRTYSQVMADPSLPWFAKIPAAISLFGSAVQAVQAIQGVGKGGSGQRSASGGAGGRESAGSIEGGGAASPTLNRSLTLIGDRFNRAQAIEIAEFMNEGTDDGLVIRGRR